MITGSGFGGERRDRIASPSAAVNLAVCVRNTLTVGVFPFENYQAGDGFQHFPGTKVWARVPSIYSY